MFKAIFKVAIISFFAIVVYEFIKAPYGRKNHHDDCVISIVEKRNGKKPCVICKKKYNYDPNFSFTLPPYPYDF